MAKVKKAPKDRVFRIRTRLSDSKLKTLLRLVDSTSKVDKIPTRKDTSKVKKPVSIMV